jgi:hypothetical protein
VEEFERKEWENYFSLMDFMDFKYVRMSVSLTQWEPVNDNNDPHYTDFERGFAFSPDFKQRNEGVPENTYLYLEAMYKILDYFEKHNKYVIIANWDRGTSQFCPGSNYWLLKKKEDGTYYSFQERDRLYVNDLEEYTESLAAIMYHLIVEKGYTCVRGISFWNEPEGLIDYEDVLVSVYESLGKQLERFDIREKVLIQAFDGAVFWNLDKHNKTGNGWEPDQVEKIIDRCGESIDIISIHNYNSAFVYDMDNKKSQGTIKTHLIEKFVKSAVKQAKSDDRERIVILEEIGSHTYCAKDELSEQDFVQRLHNAEATVAALNNNVKALGYWAYNHTYHRHYSMLGFDEVNKYHFIPDNTNYYPVALICRYIRQGSDIMDTTVKGFAKRYW